MTNKILLAGCIFVNDQGKVLFLHRNTLTRVQWELPGGKLEEGERAEEAAIREVKEELGVTAELLSQVGASSFVEDGVQYDCTWFSATLNGQVPRVVEVQKFDKI